MMFRNKKLTYILSIGLTLIIAYVSIHFYAKHRLEKILREQVPQLHYKSLSLNMASGNLALDQITLKEISNINEASAQSLEIHNIQYLTFLLKKKLHITSIAIHQPKVVSQLVDSTKTSKKIKLPKGITEINIENFSIADGQLKTHQSKKDSVLFSIENANVSLEHIQVNNSTLQERIPLHLSSYQLSGSHLLYAMGLENLKITSFRIQPEKTLIKELSLQTKYSQKNLSTHIYRERDHIDLSIPAISINTPTLTYVDSTVSFACHNVSLKKPKLIMYRDKLVADDLTFKPMYSEMIRTLPFSLHIPELAIEDGFLSYSELVKEDTKPGELVFSHLNAAITNISNTTENTENTFVKAQAKLMDNASITLDWSFNVSKEDNDFIASGTVYHFNSPSLNSYLKSNLGVQAEGAIEELYFTISGNPINAAGDMKMKYRDFRFEVLKKDRLGVNKFLTAIGNLFTNDGSKTDDDGYRYGTIKAERDPSKSFFNYLWLNVQDGMLSTMTGNGKKK